MKYWKKLKKKKDLTSTYALYLPPTLAPHLPLPHLSTLSSYLVILMRKLSTSSRTLGDRKVEKSVDPGERDSGGMCCSAFLGVYGAQSEQTRANDKCINIILDQIKIHCWKLVWIKLLLRNSVPTENLVHNINQPFSYRGPSAKLFNGISFLFF